LVSFFCNLSLSGALMYCIIFPKRTDTELFHKQINQRSCAHWNLFPLSVWSRASVCLVQSCHLHIYLKENNNTVSQIRSEVFRRLLWWLHKDSDTELWNMMTLSCSEKLINKLNELIKTCEPFKVFYSLQKHENMWIKCRRRMKGSAD
jgi:hypothetical protein